MKKILVISIFMLPLALSKEIKVFKLPGNEESFLKMVKDPGVRDFQAISMCMRQVLMVFFPFTVVLFV